jgi:hypothetical protein
MSNFFHPPFFQQFLLLFLKITVFLKNTFWRELNIGIPNTNNQLEGTFTDLKNKLRNHNGLSRKRKEKFINGFLKASNS